MSIQAGIWNFNGKPVDRKLLSDISDSLKHQGPDGESCHVDGSIALLYRPFHTTAESRREKQPYFSRRGFILTWDGRLDNRDELISELRGELEAHPTDVAIVAAAFDCWGTDCFRRIVGDWAVSIWKPGQQELLFAADYMAIRHIFYYLKNDQVWWVTDLSPLVLLSGDKFHIDDEYIAGYFAHDPEAHLTPYRGIHQVPPGHFVYIRNRTASVERFWRFNPRSRVRYKTDPEYEEHFRGLFTQSVSRRLRSNTPVLAELSGGLDSSSIVCVADDILSREETETPGLETISYYDKTEPHGDDWIYFKKIEEKRGRVGAHIDASKLGSSPTPFECSEFLPLPGHLPDGRQLDEERAEIVRRGGHRVILSGIGGDEFLGGIPNPSAQLADLIVQFKPFALAQQLMVWSLIKRRPWIRLLGQALLDLLPASLGQYFAMRARVEPWIGKAFATRTSLAARLLDVDEHFGLWLPTRRSCIAGVLLMANKLAKVQPPAAALEECRFPFLDQNLIEFILSIPASQLLRPGERRSLMRRSLIGIVPQEILSRRTKQFGARTPVTAMGKNAEHLRAIFGVSLSSQLGYVIADRFMDRLKAAQNGQEIHIARMLRTISLEFWLRDLATRGLISVPWSSPKIRAAECARAIASHRLPSLPLASDGASRERRTKR